MFPQELCEWPNWVAWKYVTQTDGKKTKLPYSVRTGQLASVNDRHSWSDFNTACHAIKNSTFFDGIGFVLTEADPFCFIDLDDPGDDAILQARHSSICASMNSYSELSPSGKGVHVIIKARVPQGRRRMKTEIYSSQRYMTMTGATIIDAPIAERQELAEQLWRELDGGSHNPAYQLEQRNEPEKYSDDFIYMTAAHAENGEKFEALWRGDFQRYYPSQSEADFALINILSFYSRNVEQIKRMFLLSALGKREKSKRKSYLDTMIKRSFDNQPPEIPLQLIVANTANKIAELEGTKTVNLNPFGNVPAPATTPEFPELQEWTRPPGLLGEIADFIYSAAPRPVKEIALGAAIGLMAGICGRAYNVSGTGLNQYVLILAKTGVGKEGAAKGIDRLMQRVKLVCPAALEFIGPSEIASGQALTKHLPKHPCFVSIVGEFGLTLQQMCSPLASPSLVQLRKKILSLYNKSGASDIERGTIYSDKEQNVGDIKSPAFTILGESTPETFYVSLDEQNIKIGLLPRFLCIEYTGDRPALNKDHTSVEPSGELIQKVGQVAANALTLAQHNKVIDVTFDADAEKFSDKFNTKCDAKINTSEQEVARQLWNRGHIKTLKLAALIAIGLNPFSPVVNLEAIEWAANLVERDIQGILKQFELGNAGRDNNELSQTNEMVSVIADYIKRPYLGFEKYRIPEKMHAQKVIPMAYLQRRLLQRSAFRSDRMGATNAIKRTLDNLVADGSMRQLRELDVYSHFGSTMKCYAVIDVTRFM